MQSRSRTLRLSTALVIGALLTGCGGGTTDGVPAFEVGLASGGAHPSWTPEFDIAAFDDPGTNPYFPLVPGTTYLYEAETEDGLEENEVYVTTDTEEILGVTCTVVLDRVWVDGELLELTYDWYAVDGDDNVWYFGEESYEYEDGAVVGTEGSWKAGVDGAEAGVLVPGSPYPGQSYRQEYAEGVAEDMAKVQKLDATASVPYRDFEDCLRTKEWNPLEPGQVEQKVYAPGVGLVLVRELSGGPSVRAELIDIATD